MKEEITLDYVSIALDEEKMWNCPSARVGRRFHYDLETEFALSESQMKAIIFIVSEFRKGRPCYDRMKYVSRRMVEDG